MKPFAILACLASCISAAPVLAADIKIKNLEGEGTMIAITGNIESGDSARFKKIAAAIDKAVVVLESNGGAALEAIEIGETIRLKGFTTLVINNSTCASACGLIWLSGSPRSLTATAKVGFHATYTGEQNIRAESGVGNALVGRYLGALNLPEKAIVFTTSAGPDQMNWLTSKNAAYYGIETMVIDDINVPKRSSSSAATPAQTESVKGNDGDKETTLWSKPKGWSVMIDHTYSNSCYMARNFSDGTLLRMGFENATSARYYFLVGNDSWTSIKLGEIYPISIQFDQNKSWEATAKGVDFAGSKMLNSGFSDKEFWAEMATAQSVSFSRNGKTFKTLDLTGSADAIDSIIQCQKASGADQQPDPFAE